MNSQQPLFTLLILIPDALLYSLKVVGNSFSISLVHGTKYIMVVQVRAGNSDRAFIQIKFHETDTRK
jgi:hypothetical protein